MPDHVVRVPSASIREVNVGVSADNLHVDKTVLLAPFEHLLLRQPIEPIGDRSGIVLHEAPRTATILGIGSAIVLGVVLPIQVSLTNNLPSVEVDAIELVDHGSDFALNTPNGIGIVAVLIMLGDDIANRHSVSFPTLCSVIVRYCSHGQNKWTRLMASPMGWACLTVQTLRKLLVIQFWANKK